MGLLAWVTLLRSNGLVNQALALTHVRSFDGEWRTRVTALDARKTIDAAENANPMRAAPYPSA